MANLTALTDLLGIRPAETVPYLVYGGSPVRFWRPKRLKDEQITLYPYHSADPEAGSVRVGETLPDCYEVCHATPPERLAVGDIVAFAARVDVPVKSAQIWQQYHEDRLHCIMLIERRADPRTVVPDDVYRFTLMPLETDGTMLVPGAGHRAVVGVHGNHYLYRVPVAVALDPAIYTAPVPFNSRRIGARTLSNRPRSPASSPGRRIRIRT